MVVGDLTDRESLKAALKDVRYLFHVAADYRLWARDPSEIIRANVEGTLNLKREAMAAGVERIVYTSSVAALRVAGATAPVDETAALSPEEAIGAYKRSKTMAERAVEDMILREGLPAIIVSPTTPIGPRDIRPTPTGRILLDAARGRIPAFVDTGLELRPCRRRRRRPSAGLREGPHRRTLYPGRREPDAAATARDHRRAGRPQGAAAQAAARAA